MNLKFLLLLLVLPFSVYSQNAITKDAKLYEMRTYYAHPGKLEDLQRRFREHTTKLFEKHGMTNVGYWVPLENLDNKIVYILSYPDKEAREKAWKAFGEDPAWKKAQSLSESSGKLISKIETVFMKATDFSPEVKADSLAGERVFELRVYHSPEGKLPDLMNRFRGHTTKLFEKHGMRNIGYWQPIEGQKDSNNTLIYILSHKSKQDGERSFKSFVDDEEWLKVKQSSEAKGPIVEKIESTYMQATDYSPIK